MELGELALYDLQGDRIGVRAITGPADADALCDEADTVPRRVHVLQQHVF